MAETRNVNCSRNDSTIYMTRYCKYILTLMNTRVSLYSTININIRMIISALHRGMYCERHGLSIQSNLDGIDAAWS